MDSIKPMIYFLYDSDRGHHGRDRIVVGFTTNYAISAYHHERCEFESCLWRAVLDTTLCDKVCQWHAAGRWFSPGTLVSSTNKTDCHDRTITTMMAPIAVIKEISFDKTITNVCQNYKFKTVF
jgi:hypothetical protein